MVGESVCPWQEMQPPESEARSAMANSGAYLKTETDIGCDREKRLSSVDVAESLKRDEPVDHSGDHDIFRQGRPIGYADAGIGADARVDVVLKQEQLQRLRVDEADEVHVHESAEFRSDVDIGSGIDQRDAGIYEARLAFNLARPETRDEAAALNQSDAGAGE